MNVNRGRMEPHYLGSFKTMTTTKTKLQQWRIIGYVLNAIQKNGQIYLDGLCSFAICFREYMY